MPLAPAKCPECGGLVEVDSEKRAGLCQHCRQPFVVEDAIQTFNTYFQTTNNYNTTHNYGDGAVVNVYEDPNKDFVIEAGVLKEYHGASKDVVIPDSVEEIGADCFAGMNINSITIPSSVNKICKPFGCKLYDMNWGYSIKNTHIDFIIDDNEKFEYVNNCIIDKINKSIVFAQKDIEEFPTFKDFDIQVVEFGAFIGCNNLRKIFFPDNIKCLEMYSFNSCELNSIYFEHDIEIGYSCFRNCWNLKSIICKGNVRLKLDSYIFNDCKNIEVIVSKDIFKIAKNESKDLGLVGLINPILKEGIICVSFSPMLYSEEKRTYKIYDSYERYLSLNNKNINKDEKIENYIESKEQNMVQNEIKKQPFIEYIATGETIEKAVANAKVALNVEQNEKVKIEILEFPKKKVFGGQSAKVKVTIK